MMHPNLYLSGLLIKSCRHVRVLLCNELRQSDVERVFGHLARRLTEVKRESVERFGGGGIQVEYDTFTPPGGVG